MSDDGNAQGDVESINSSFSGGTITPDARSAVGTGKIDIAKLLSQNNELKKLLTEEQRRAKLADDERRKKDQELRRVEIEMDGFRFRNDQLLKRIEVLQTEMAHSAPSTSGKSSSKGKADRHVDSANEVVEQELMKRIQENSELRNRLENVETLSREQADLTAKRMAALENDLLATEQKHKMATSSLKQERDLLYSRCSGLEKQLQTSTTDKDSTISMLEAKVASLESQVQIHKGDQSVSSSALLTESLCPYEYSRLNLNCSDVDQAAAVTSRQRSKSMASFSTNSEALLLSLGAYATSINTLIQRIGTSSTSLSNATAQVRTTVGALQKLPSSSSNSSLISQATSVVEALANTFRQLVSSGDSSMHTANGVCDTADRLVSLSREAAALLANEIPAQASDWLRLAQLSSSASGLVHDHYASLVVAFVGRGEVKTALDSALQALAGASSTLDAFSSLLDSRARSADVNASPLASSAASLRHQFSARTSALRASCHITSRPTAVPYSRAIELDSLLSKTEAERAALAERAERLSKRLRTAEEERERWMVEAQLRQVRYEKLLQRITGSTSPSPNLGVPGSNSNFGVSPSSSISNLSSRPRDGSIIDDPTASSVLHQNAKAPTVDAGDSGASSNGTDQTSIDVSWLTRHFEERLSLVSTDAQRADSEASTWKAECRALVARLVQARQLGTRVTSLEKSLAERDDELETVRRSYESQLAAMAEHLASMNERIVKQADDAEALQRQIRIQQQSAAAATSATSGSTSSSSRLHSKKLLGKPG